MDKWVVPHRHVVTFMGVDGKLTTVTVGKSNDVVLDPDKPDRYRAIQHLIDAGIAKRRATTPGEADDSASGDAEADQPATTSDEE